MVDVKNFAATMIFICDTFEMAHNDMVRLRQRIEKVYHGQPKKFSQRGKQPVSLHGITVAIGLCIAFGGGRSAVDAVLKLPSHKVIEMGRKYDPFN